MSIVKNVKMIQVQDWNKLVSDTYNKRYNFQQQDGCKPRGTYNLTVSLEETYDYDDETVPDVINGNERGVSFKYWLKRDPEEWNGKKEDERFLDLFWRRNFYPNIETVANDLHEKGLIEAGDYLINIDW